MPPTRPTKQARNIQLMSQRRAFFDTSAPSATNQAARARSLPHCPAEIQAPGSSSSAQMTPRLAGLKTCLPFTRSTNFDAMASAAASGCTHSVSARSRMDSPKQVMTALRYAGAPDPEQPQAQRLGREPGAEGERHLLRGAG